MEEDYAFAEHKKRVIIPTPFNGVNMFLSRNETERLSNILEEADNEAQPLSLIYLLIQ